MSSCSRWFSLGLVSLALIVGAACRDESHAPVPYNQDLGTPESPLPPPSAPVMTAKIAEGTAEFVAFRDPDEEPEARPEPQPEGDGDGGEAPAPQGDAAAAAVAPGSPASPKVESAIKDLIADYNGYVGGPDASTLPLFFVIEQRDAFTSMVTAQGTLAEAFDNLAKPIIEKLPESADRIAPLRRDLVPNIGGKLEVNSLTMISANEILAQISADGVPLPPLMLRWLPDDQAEEEGASNWFMQSPILAVAPAILTNLGNREKELARVIEALQGGTMTPEQAMAQLELMAKAASEAQASMAAKAAAAMAAGADEAAAPPEAEKEVEPEGDVADKPSGEAPGEGG